MFVRALVIMTGVSFGKAVEDVTKSQSRISNAPYASKEYMRASRFPSSYRSHH